MKNKQLIQYIWPQVSGDIRSQNKTKETVPVMLLQKNSDSIL